MDALMYYNLISTFFVENKLIHSKKDRYEKCLAYVKKVTQGSSSKTIYKAIVKGIRSINSTFMKKWRESNCDLERFKRENDSWIHKYLEVQIFLQAI